MCDDPLTVKLEVEQNFVPGCEVVHLVHPWASNTVAGAYVEPTMQLDFSFI